MRWDGAVEGRPLMLRRAWDPEREVLRCGGPSIRSKTRIGSKPREIEIVHNDTR